MGIYDRGYYDGDQWKGGSGNDRPRMQFGMGTGNFKQTIVAKLILINVVIFALDVFSPRVTFQFVKESGAAVYSALLSPFQESKAATDEKKTAEKSKLGDGKKSNSQLINVALSLKTGMTPVGYSGPADNLLCIYQFISYGFAHTSINDGFGLTHIAFNMFMLFMFGIPIEEKYGREEFLKFYMLALVLAGVVWWAMTAFVYQTPGRAVGASGAVVAVVMLFVFNFPKQKIYFLGILPAPAWVMGLLMVGSDMFSAANTESRIAVEAHLTGAAFAALYFFGRMSLGWLKTGWIADRLSRKPNLKVHDPEKEEELSNEADRILEKVHREGEASLSRKERKTLQRYSKNVRKSRDD